MKRTLLTLLLLLFVASVAFAQESSKGVSVEAVAGQKYAILIGINDYVQLNKLQFAKNDIEALRDELYKIGFEKENVYCLTCGSAETKNLPTKEHIEVVIESVLEMAKKGDIVVVAMSGHGIEVEGQARFCTLNTNGDNVLATTIPIGDVFSAFEKSKATFKLMLVDACRDNPFGTRSVAGASALQSLTDPPEGVMLLQSCKKGERSYEDQSLKRGVFTHYLVKGLQGEAADEEGKITLLNLVSYSIIKTQRHTLDQFRAKQQPYLRGETTDFVLANVSIAPPTPVVPPTPPSAPSPTRAGERMTLTIKDVDYAFRWCPPGKFIMGSPTSEERRNRDETQHQVTLSRGFWMLETQVTQLMWESVMGSNPSKFNGINLPVEQVSWNDCQEYIQKLNSLLAGTPGVPSGFKFSLPTEAQWEYACRAGTSTPFNFGSTLNGDKANCDGNFPYGTSTKGQYLVKTTEVGSYPANAWGLYDMHGNVWEWCADWYGDYPRGVVIDPGGSPSGSLRVRRGGSWHSDAGDCRSADRDCHDPSSGNRSIGLRLSLVSQ